MLLFFGNRIERLLLDPARDAVWILVHDDFAEIMDAEHQGGKYRPKLRKALVPHVPDPVVPRRAYPAEPRRFEGQRLRGTQLKIFVIRHRKGEHENDKD